MKCHPSFGELMPVFARSSRQAFIDVDLRSSLSDEFRVNQRVPPMLAAIKRTPFNPPMIQDIIATPCALLPQPMHGEANRED